MGEADDLLWLAAMGMIGDMGGDLPFPELAEANARYGKTALRGAVTLVNAPRRTAAADATPALRLLLASDGPKAITRGDSPDAQALRDAKAEVAAELAVAKTIAPRMRGGIALVVFASPCQIHPLIAQQWRGRLKNEIVLAANIAYRPGRVYFAARSATGVDLLAFLAGIRPEGADGQYGSRHKQGTGGALRLPQWNTCVAAIGFPEAALPLDQRLAA